MPSVNPKHRDTILRMFDRRLPHQGLNFEHGYPRADFRELLNIEAMSVPGPRCEGGGGHKDDWQRPQNNSDNALHAASAQQHLSAKTRDPLINWKVRLMGLDHADGAGRASAFVCNHVHNPEEIARLMNLKPEKARSTIRRQA